MEVLIVRNDDMKFTSPEETVQNGDPEEPIMIEMLSKRLEDELRLARKQHVFDEVLLPHGLTVNIARRVCKMAELEPCGLRGCTLYVECELKDEKRKIATIKCDASIPPTFEMYLTLKQATAGWNLFLPQFFKKITRGAVMISPEYVLQKKKLYRS